MENQNQHHAPIPGPTAYFRDYHPGRSAHGFRRRPNGKRNKLRPLSQKRDC